MSRPQRRLFLVVGFEIALLAVAAALGRVTPLLLVIVGAACVIEVVRFKRATDAPPATDAALPRRDREDPDREDEVDEGVQGADLAADGDPWNLDARLAEAERQDPEGLQMGAVALAHADELVPYVDVDPSYLDGYDWYVGMHDEVRLFVDDDSLSEVEGDDALESRFARAPGITQAMREDREIVHLTAPGMTARQVHALAVDVLADAAHATQRLRNDG